MSTKVLPLPMAVQELVFVEFYKDNRFLNLI